MVKSGQWHLYTCCDDHYVNYIVTVERSVTSQSPFCAWRPCTALWIRGANLLFLSKAIRLLQLRLAKSSLLRVQVHSPVRAYLLPRGCALAVSKRALGSTGRLMERDFVQRHHTSQKILQVGLAWGLETWMVRHITSSHTIFGNSSRCQCTYHDTRAL